MPASRNQLSLKACDLADAMRDVATVSGVAIFGTHDFIQRACDDEFHKIAEGAFLHVRKARVLAPFRYVVDRGTCVSFQFVRSGGFRLQADGQVVQVRSGHVRINGFRRSVAEFKAGEEEQTGVSLIVEREAMVTRYGLEVDRLRGDVRDVFLGSPDELVSLELLMEPETWLSVERILGCAYQGALRNSYLVAKASELICQVVAEINKKRTLNTAAVETACEREQRLVALAARIYRLELRSPPSIDELSRRVGLNRNKLNQGFRDMFGMTPAEFSRHARLSWARDALPHGTSVAQVASDIGYESVAAFGRAFREQYGFSPSQAGRHPAGGDGSPGEGREPASA